MTATSSPPITAKVRWMTKGLDTPVPVAVGADGKVVPGVKTVWAPYPGAQTKLLSSPVFETIVLGGRGSAKTVAIIADALRGVGKGYGSAWLCVFLRRESKDLDDIIRKSRDLIPKIYPDAEFVRSPSPEWRFATGERLVFGHMKREEHLARYQGWEIAWLAVDEVGQFPTPDLILTLVASIRSSSVPQHELRLRLAANPGGPGHNWIRKRYKLKAYGVSDRPDSRRVVGQVLQDTMEDGSKSKQRVAIGSRLEDNIVLLAKNPDYRLGIMTATSNNKHLQRAWVEGRWDILAGGMIDDVWDAKTHVVTPFVIPDSWRIDRSYDHGQTSPYSVLFWAESDGTDYQDAKGRWRSSVRGDLFCIGEIYGCAEGQSEVGVSHTPQQIAEAVVRWELGSGYYGRIRPGPADTQINGGEGGITIASQMRNPVRINGREYAGPRWTDADKRKDSRQQGWERLREMLTNALPPEVGVREREGLFIFETCEHWIENVPALQRHPKKPDDTADEAIDHDADATRYRIRKAKAGRALKLARGQ